MYQFKKSDKVYVKSLAEIRKIRTDTDIHGGIILSRKIEKQDICFTRPMQAHCNKQVTIAALMGLGLYRIEEDLNAWSWCEEMFKESSQIVKIITQLKQEINAASI